MVKIIRILVEHMPNGKLVGCAYLGEKKFIETVECVDMSGLLDSLDLLLASYDLSLGAHDFSVEHAFVDESIPNL